MGLMNLVKDGMVKRIFSHISENVILLLDGSFFRNVNDIVLILAYVSPDKSPIYTDENDNGIEILSTNVEQIVPEYRDAELFLAGDLNSQTKDLLIMLSTTISIMFLVKMFLIQKIVLI